MAVSFIDRFFKIVFVEGIFCLIHIRSYDLRENSGIRAKTDSLQKMTGKSRE